MKNNTHVAISAPGKLMLVGEHAVVYGHPCIVTAVDKRICINAEASIEKIFTLDAAGVGISNYSKPIREIGYGEMPKEVRFVETTLKHFFKRFPQEQGVSMTSSADFSCTVGFGSSSAVVVASLCALVKLFSVSVSEKELFIIARDIVVDVQGRASGFDVASALYGGTIYFAGLGATIEPLPVPTFPIVIGYTGVKADTSSMVSMVAEKKKQYPGKVERIFQAIEKIVIEVRERINEKDWQRVGKLMDFNQEYLRDLGCSTEKLETLISAAKGAGAYGAKLSGAGGGDCMIAVYPESEKGKQKIMDAINISGGTVIDAGVNALGVCVDEGEKA